MFIQIENYSSYDDLMSLIFQTSKNYGEKPESLNFQKFYSICNF